MWFFGKRSGINLIPEEERALRAKKIRLVTTVILVVLVGLELLVYLLFTTLHLREENLRDKIADNIQQRNAQWQKVASSATSLKVVKNKISEYQTFSNKYFVVEEYVKAVRDIVPAKVDLTNLTIGKDGSTKIGAEAPSPAEIFQFLNVLNDSPEKFSSPILVSANKITGGYSFDVEVTVMIK